MRDYTKFLVSGDMLSCPRTAYPVPIERCYRCRYFRDLQQTSRGEDIVCCDYIEVGVDRELFRAGRAVN